MKYMKPGDPDSFKDMEVKPCPEDWQPDTNLCPKCKGHGGWHLKIDAYGKDVHFDASCSQCWSWGWVKEEDKDCIHEWAEKKIGNCLHEWSCTKCGRTRVVDSSG